MMKNFIVIAVVTLLCVGCSKSAKEKEIEREELEQLQGRGSSSNSEFIGADEYCKTISGFTCRQAIVDEAGWLIVGIDATGGNYDNLAQQFLDEAKSNGVIGLKGCGIVNYSTSEFQQGAVVGERIGKAYN